MKAIKNLAKQLISFCVKPLVVIWFWSYRWYRHNEFLQAMNSQALGGPSLLSRPVLRISHFFRFLHRQFTVQFSDYALNKYVQFVAKHYAKGGLGYGVLESLSDQECAAVFAEIKGRIASYIKYHPQIIRYQDGESFLDVGCGKGQNVKELIDRYPNSLIKAFDVSDEALRVVRCGTKGNSKVLVEHGSAFDFDYLKTYPDHSFDHVIMSHVLPHLLASNVDETLVVRQKLIDELIRISRKSVILMSAIHYWPGEDLKTGTSFRLEQNTRGALNEPVARYFDKYRSTAPAQGEFCMLFGDETSSAIYFRKT